MGAPHERPKHGFDSYFTEVSFQKRIFYQILLLYVGIVILVSLIEPFMTPASCLEFVESGKDFGNSLYNYNPCRWQRKAYLLFLSPDECSYCRRLVIAVLLGGFIGWERRQADRPAGIRTMALVSLGSCLFTINSAFAFLDGPQEWDASRISAAIPSGVGFLGAGLIFKQAEKDEKSGGVTHVVHGLTTAASLWLSAAVGIACGGTLYFAASYGTAIMLVLLRFGPRIMDDHNVDDEDHDNVDDDLGDSKYDHDTRSEREAVSYPLGGLDDRKLSERGANETSSLLSQDAPSRNSSRNLSSHASMRKRAHLGNMV